MSKILHITFEGTVAQANEDEVQMKCKCLIQETGEEVRVLYVYPQVTLRTTLGVDKLPVVLTQELILQAQEYLDTVHRESGFTKVLVTGGYDTL